MYEKFMICFLDFFIHGTSITVHVQLCTDSSNWTQKTTCSGVPIDISFLGGVTPSPHDKAWFRARNWNMKDWLPEKPDVDDHGMTVCG